jgi:hypothetical protein
MDALIKISINILSDKSMEFVLDVLMNVENPTMQVQPH